MEAILNLKIWLPVFVQIIQLLVFIPITIFTLKKSGVIRYPLAGLEYSQAIFAGVTIFSVLLISTSGAPAMFQFFKTYQQIGQVAWQSYLVKCGQFFFVTFFFELILGIIVLSFARRILFLENLLKEICTGSIPSALLAGSILLGFAAGLRIMSSEIMEYITPQYLNFR